MCSYRNHWVSGVLEILYRGHTPLGLAPPLPNLWMVEKAAGGCKSEWEITFWDDHWCRSKIRLSRPDRPLPANVCITQGGEHGVAGRLTGPHVICSFEMESKEVKRIYFALALTLSPVSAHPSSACNYWRSGEAETLFWRRHQKLIKLVSGHFLALIICTTLDLFLVRRWESPVTS